MTTALTIAGLATFPLVALVIVVRAIRRPDHDDFLDDPDHWGAM